MEIDSCFKDFEMNSCEQINCDIKESIKNILNSEADTAKCLSSLFLNIADELKNTYPIEKRVVLTKQVVNAYACKEKAMSDLINSLNCFYITTLKSSHKDKQIYKILSVLIFLLIFKRMSLSLY